MNLSLPVRGLPSVHSVPSALFLILRRFARILPPFVSILHLLSTSPAVASAPSTPISPEAAAIVLRTAAVTIALAAVGISADLPVDDIEIPFIDLPLPYSGSGPFVSIPATVIGGAIGAAIGALFIPPALIVAILPGFSLLDAIFVPLETGFWIGVHTIGRVVGAPLWLVKTIVWDIPKWIIF